MKGDVGVKRLSVLMAGFALLAKGEATRIDASSNVGDTTYLLSSKRDGRGYLLVTSLF